MHPVDLSALEAELDTVDGLRAQLQHSARQQLVTEGLPVTRATVVTRAVELLRTTTADDQRPVSTSR